MPAIPLIRVDLPAPLSPTRAVTCPAQASRFTPLSTCTAPKLFWIPRQLSGGLVLGVVCVLSVMLPRSWEPGAARRPAGDGGTSGTCRPRDSDPAVRGGRRPDPPVRARPPASRRGAQL